MELLNENKTYTVDSIINTEFSVSELDEIIKTGDEILKCAVLLNENTDERIITLLCNDPNTLVSNWARTKLNKCSSELSYINLSSKCDVIASKIMLDCFQSSSTGGITIFLDELIDKYNLSDEDINNVYEILICNDDILQIDFDKGNNQNIYDLSFDIFFNWHKCFYYEPMTEDEQDYINFQRKYIELYKNRFFHEINIEKNNINSMTVTDRLTNTPVLRVDSIDSQLAELYFHNILIDSIDNVLDESLEEQCNEFEQIQY